MHSPTHAHTNVYCIDAHAHIHTNTGINPGGMEEVPTPDVWMGVVTGVVGLVSYNFQQCEMKTLSEVVVFSEIERFVFIK